MPLTGALGMSKRLGEKDDMFKKGMEEHYLNVGRSGLEAIRLAMIATGTSTFTNVLDLPCGHGRVLRALKAAFPLARLTACDLNREGVKFCVETFGAVGHDSEPSPDRIELEGGYDLIWSGGLLTHLDKAHCQSFLRLFAQSLAPGGVAVVTTHGRLVAGRLRAGTHLYGLEAASLPPIVEAFDRSGFGYADYPGKKGYGISVCTPEWLMQATTDLPGVTVALFTERFWDRHQDVLAFQRHSAGRPG